MAIQALIRSGDTIKVSRSFGIVGSAVINGSNVPVIVVAANSNEPVPSQQVNINKPLVKMINALASIDGFIKQRLENQKIISANERLAQRESLVEQQNTEPQIEVIQPDAERVGGSNAGLLALGGLALLTLDPVQEAIKDLFDGVVAMSRFVTGVVSSISGAFKFFVGSSSASETPSEAPAATPKEGGVVATPAPPVQEGVPPTPTPTEPQATPAEKPSLFGSVASSALTGAAIGSFIPRVGTGVGAAIGGAYGALSYAFGGGSSSSSTPAPSAPVATGGATSAPASTSTSKSTPAEESAVAGNIIQVNHPETGAGYGIAGANDQQGRPIAFSKEGAEAFAKMMADSGGAVKPSDVASSKRSLQKNTAVGGATNSPHLRGVAMDIHGTSSAWIRQHGHKYGWKPHDYAGTHGGHFVFGGPGLVPDEGSPTSGMASAIGSIANQSLEQLGKLFGAIGGAVVDPGIPRTDVGASISEAAKQLNTEVAANRTETPPSPPTPPAPPRINKTESGAVQNPATAADRNGVYYYLRRFGYQDLTTPESTLMPATAAA